MMNALALAVPLVEYTAARLVHYCADSELGLARCRAAIDAAEARGLPFAPDDAAAALADAPHADAILIDLTHDWGAPLDALLGRIAQDAGIVPAIVQFAPALLDPVVARLGCADVALLCDPGPTERIAALAAALAPRVDPNVRELGDDPPQQLRQLSEEVSRIARALAQLSEADSLGLRENGGDYHARDGAPAGMPEASAIRAMIRARRLREQFFDSELFADPAWDMLLDLLAAHLEQRRVSVSSLCIAAAVPPTTALRWIKRLTDEGLFVRAADPDDGRRIFIDLSDAAANGLAAYFRALARTGIALT
jgi:hypothetical protein